MVRTRQSAVTAISYGLIAALVAAVSIGALTAAGVDIETIFSTTGNAIAITMTVQPSNPIGFPNANLTSEQQSEIVNAAAEIADGTASVACLQNMNNSANAAIMASNGGTCLGPGLNIAPPQEPIKEFFNTNNYPDFTYPDGQIYAFGESGPTQNATNINAPGAWFYNDGFVMNNENWVACSDTNGYSNWYSPSTVTTTQGTSVSCTGGEAIPGFAPNSSQSVPMGYLTGDTW